MTRTLRIAALAAALLLGGLLAHAQAAPAKKIAPRPAVNESTAVGKAAGRSVRLVVYYFHTTQRCTSCRAIEAYAHEAIVTGFPDSLRSGGIVWKLVNIDEKAHRHFIQDFRLYTKSVVLVSESKGRPLAWRNLERIWELLPDRAAFQRYVQAEVRAWLAPRS